MVTSEDVLGGLLDTYHSLTLQVREVRERIHEACLVHSVEQLNYNGMTLTFKPETDYDPMVLSQLGEFFSPEDIEKMKNKPKERTWNKTQLNKLIRQGGEIGRIIREARRKTEPGVKIKLPPSTS